MPHGTIPAGAMARVGFVRTHLGTGYVELPALVMPKDAPPSPACDKHTRRGKPSVFCSECFAMSLAHWQKHARPPTKAERLYNALTGNAIEE